MSDIVPDAEVGDGRESWGSHLEFVLAVAGYAIGSGNVIRFPFLTYRYGGGTFLVPYFLSLVVLGIPLFILETVLGQTMRMGIYAVMKAIHPRFRGVGVASVILLVLVSIYFNILLAWSLYYTVRSFESPLPWAAENITVGNFTLQAAERFWFDEVLRYDPSSPFEPSFMVVHLLATLLISWVGIFLALSGGVRTTGKVVYFTVTMPFVLLFILLIRAITLPGASTGISFYLTPDLEQLTDPEVWVRAAQQVFYSLGLSWGTLTALASYNKPHYHLVRDSILIAFVNSLVSFVAGFVVFGIIGYMSEETGLPVESVVDQGPGLVFVVIPEGITLLPASNVFSFMFFLNLFLLGVDSQFADVEALSTFARDIGFPGKEWQIVGAICLLCALCGLLMITDAGIDWFTLFDDYVALFGLFAVGVVQSVSVSWYYGAERLANEYEALSGHKIPGIVLVSWKYICPVLTFLLLIAAFINEGTKEITIPRYAHALGLCMAIAPFLPLIVMAIFPDTGVKKALDRNWKAFNSGNEARKLALGNQPSAGAVEL